MEGESVKSQILEGLDQNREIEVNKLEALKMAAQLFEIVSNPEIINSTTPEERHKALIEKAKSFSDAFPIVVSKMAREVIYNENAFRKYLDKLHTNPGKGMEGFIERQADYVKFLYIEECKANKRHWNSKTANLIWQTEHSHMSKWMKKVKKQEEEARNEFEEEEKRHLEERRNELFEWLQTELTDLKENDPNKFVEMQIDVNQVLADDTNSTSTSDFSTSDFTKSEVESEVEKSEDKKSEVEKSEVEKSELEVDVKSPQQELYEKSMEERFKAEYEQVLAKKEQDRIDMLKDTNIYTWKQQKKNPVSSKKRKNKK